MHQPVPEILLSDGVSLPILGFGTYTLNGAAGAGAIGSAITAGYRLIDSAFNYENEGAVGLAVRRSEVPRHMLRITSKLPGRHHRYGEALTTIQESLYRAGLDYYDLYLIHWPNPKQGHFVEAWQALIQARQWGLVRSIGVCNFLPRHIETLQSETGVLPSVNQIELHPHFSQKVQLAFNAASGIATESWSPLGRDMSTLTKLPELQTIAKAHGKTVAQVVLRWHIQCGAIPIPKSATPARQMENLSIFDFQLSQGEIDILDELDRPDGRLKNQDPDVYEEF